MTLKTLLGISAAALTLGTAASAATVQITEGQRPRVVGTTAVADPGVAIALGTVTQTDTATVYGSIVPGRDVYTFDSIVSFSINWLFGGFDFDDGNGGVTSTNASGLRQGPVTQSSPNDKMVDFDLFLGTSQTGTLVGDETFTADIISGPTNVFSQNFAAGSYTLVLDGLGTDRAVDYDIEFAAATTAPIPLPASALLLLGAVGGLGFAARRKSA